MAKSPTTIGLTYVERAIKTLVKAGINPRVVVDIHAGTMTIEAANDAEPAIGSGWQERAPDRV